MTSEFSTPTPAGSRHLGRESAVQALYQLEILRSNQFEDALPFFEQLECTETIREFGEHLTLQTLEHQPEIDQWLQANLENWKLNRLSILVRSILRVATYEMAVSRETPYQVVIDEALELARSFVDDPSRSFINSVLQKIVDHCGLTELPE